MAAATAAGAGGGSLSAIPEEREDPSDQLIITRLQQAIEETRKSRSDPLTRMHRILGIYRDIPEDYSPSRDETVLIDQARSIEALFESCRLSDEEKALVDSAQCIDDILGGRGTWFYEMNPGKKSTQTHCFNLTTLDPQYMLKLLAFVFNKVHRPREVRTETEHKTETVLTKKYTVSLMPITRTSTESNYMVERVTKILLDVLEKRLRPHIERHGIFPFSLKTRLQTILQRHSNAVKEFHRLLFNDKDHEIEEIIDKFSTSDDEQKLIQEAQVKESMSYFSRMHGFDPHNFRISDLAGGPESYYHQILTRLYLAKTKPFLELTIPRILFNPVRVIIDNRTVTLYKICNQPSPTRTENYFQCIRHSSAQTLDEILSILESQKEIIESSLKLDLDTKTFLLGIIARHRSVVVEFGCILVDRIDDNREKEKIARQKIREKDLRAAYQETARSTGRSFRVPRVTRTVLAK